MKRQAYIMIAVLILVSALSLTAQAQSSSRQRLAATIPFAFTVGEKTLPAGEYTVSVINPASDRSVLEFRSEDGRSSAMTQTMGVIGKAKDAARLCFHRYGNQYLFAQAWMGSEGTGLAALNSKAERSMRQKFVRGRRSDVAVVKLR